MNEDQFRYIDELRKSSGMTNQQIAEHSGIPIGTVARILSGQTKDPSYVTLSCIIIAMGGSMDELHGCPRVCRDAECITTPCACDHCRALDTSRSAYQNAYDSIRAQHDVELQRVRSYLDIKDRWLKWMFFYCVIITIAAIVIAVCR